MRLQVALSAFAIAVSVSAFGQSCGYQTVAGLPITFRGDNAALQTALFNAPSAVAAGADGTIYVADTGNNRVRAISPAGLVRTVAGTGEAAFRGDGGAATAAA